jgi:hypothetical protein
MVYSYIMAWVVNVNRKVKKQLAKHSGNQKKARFTWR